MLEKAGAPDRIRTCDLCLRSRYRTGTPDYEILLQTTVSYRFILNSDFAGVPKSTPRFSSE